LFFYIQVEMIRTFDEIGFGEEYLPHQSCIAIYIYHCNATDYLFGGDRHTSYVAKRGQRPLWSALSARRLFESSRECQRNPAISIVAGFLFLLIQFYFLSFGHSLDIVG
jgi:hypothetical protein